MKVGEDTILENFQPCFVQNANRKRVCQNFCVNSMKPDYRYPLFP
ncbi:hypothetical protein [Brevibacillus brevis]